jgi:hypothetical protein
MPSWDSEVMPQAIASFNPKVNRNQQITAVNSFIAEGGWIAGIIRLILAAA